MCSVFTCIVWNRRVLLLLCVWEALDSESMNVFLSVFSRYGVCSKRAIGGGNSEVIGMNIDVRPDVLQWACVYAQ